MTITNRIENAAHFGRKADAEALARESTTSNVRFVVSESSRGGWVVHTASSHRDLIAA